MVFSHVFLDLYFKPLNLIRFYTRDGSAPRRQVASWPVQAAKLEPLYFCLIACG